MKLFASSQRRGKTGLRIPNLSKRPHGDYQRDLTKIRKFSSIRLFTGTGDFCDKPVCVFFGVYGGK